MQANNFSKILVNLLLITPLLDLAKSDKQVREALKISFWSIIFNPCLTYYQHLLK